MKKIFQISIIFLCFSLIPIVNAETLPSWIKNTAGWWATDSISETEFITAIEYLVNIGIIVVQDDVNPISQSQLLPSWIKNTAGWWSQDSISDDEFVSSISFLINNGIISLESNCNKIIDDNRNQIPDEIENLPNINGIPGSELTLFNIQFDNRDWSNCKMPKDLSFYDFKAVNFSNADFSNTNLFNTIFNNSTFVDTNFSNSDLQGAVFQNSLLHNVNFSNTDFSLETYESPFLHFSFYQSSVYTHCSFKPCSYRTVSDLDIPDNIITDKIFGKNSLPMNITPEKKILDLSDVRMIYRLVPSFMFNDIKNTNFNNSDLSHAQFGNNKITNVDFSQSDISQSVFYNSNFEKVKFQNESFDEKKYVDFLKNNERKPYPINSIPNQKFEKNVNFSDIVLKNVIDSPPINWSMGMTLYDEKLFVANTDDHSIDVFETDNFELIQSFSSPLQNECLTTNTWTIVTDCKNSLRNLPTSLTILDDKIFVSYGFQNDIQIFDLDGNFIKKFGQTGAGQEEFFNAFDIISNKNELFVLDSGNQRIQVFNNDGNFLREFSITDKFFDSEKMAVSIFEDELFVMLSSESSVKKFTLDGKLINIIYLSTIKPNSITSISVVDDLLLVADSKMNKLFIFNLNGEQILSFGNSGNFYGEFNSPQEVLFDGKKIFVSDAHNYRIQVFELIR